MFPLLINVIFKAPAGAVISLTSYLMSKAQIVTSPFTAARGEPVVGHGALLPLLPPPQAGNTATEMTIAAHIPRIRIGEVLPNVAIDRGYLGHLSQCGIGAR
jgi:hypothetical protein